MATKLYLRKLKNPDNTIQQYNVTDVQGKILVKAKYENKVLPFLATYFNKDKDRVKSHFTLVTKRGYASTTANNAKGNKWR